MDSRPQRDAEHPQEAASPRDPTNPDVEADTAEAVNSREEGNVGDTGNPRDGANANVTLNPYEAPRSRLTGEFPAADRDPSEMPLGTRVTIFALGLGYTIQLVSLGVMLLHMALSGGPDLRESLSYVFGGYALVTMPVLGMLLMGLVKAWRLAWQAVRLLVFLEALALFVVFSAVVADSNNITFASMLPGASMVAQFVLALVVYGGLDTRSSLRWFGLICPHCGQVSYRTPDLLFLKVRCRRCKLDW
jgi:hypothetical protein